MFPHFKFVCLKFLTKVISYPGETKAVCSFCQKTYTCVNRNKKLTTSNLKNHLLREHSCKPEVRTAYLLDDAEKLLDATPRQTILKYAKAMSKQDCNVDHYIRGSHMDVEAATWMLI